MTDKNLLKIIDIIGLYSAEIFKEKPEKNKLESFVSQIEDRAVFLDINNVEDYKRVKSLLLGKKSVIFASFSKIKDINDKSKVKEFASGINFIKNIIEDNIEKHKKKFLEKDVLEKTAKEYIDITLPPKQDPIQTGKIHLISKVCGDVISILSDMGFELKTGPDIETEYYNFDMLNMPNVHPARQMFDTFFLEGGKILRTHTSPVQIRAMLDGKPDFKIMSVGKVYRCDSDQTHTPMFHQVEGLMVDKKTHAGHLKWVLEQFCQNFFEIDNIKTRFRASYFPFTEPSFEVDIAYKKQDNNIVIGDFDNWLEILGCGMVAPEVLENVNLNPDIYQGFAFGIGIDRLAMLKYGASDLRSFFACDLDWLNHYGFSFLE